MSLVCKSIVLQDDMFRYASSPNKIIAFKSCFFYIKGLSSLVICLTVYLCCYNIDFVFHVCKWVQRYSLLASQQPSWLNISVSCEWMIICIHLELMFTLSPPSINIYYKFIDKWHALILACKLTRRKLYIVENILTTKLFAQPCCSCKEALFF